MDLVYSDWMNVRNSDNRIIGVYCPFCQRSVAELMKRYVTDRDGERSTQYRVTCPVCGDTGKTYQNQNVAIQSWKGQEHSNSRPSDFVFKAPHYIHYGKEY